MTPEQNPSTPQSNNGTAADSNGAVPAEHVIRELRAENAHLREELQKLREELKRTEAERKSLQRWIYDLHPEIHGEPMTEEDILELQRTGIPFEEVLRELEQIEGFRVSK